MLAAPLFLFFFFNDTAPTEIYTLSLHDALPISVAAHLGGQGLECFLPLYKSIRRWSDRKKELEQPLFPGDRKSTRLNSSHGYISYAVFCLKKKKTKLNALALL